MNIAIVGSGYVGLVAAACFAELGHEVVCVDNDEAKVAALQRGEVPIHERFLPELLGRHRNERLRFSTSLRQAVKSSTVIFIAVGTPAGHNGECDLSYVEEVSREIAEAVGTGVKLVVEKSTVPVCTCEWVRKVMCLNGADARSFEVASNPEFLREGTAVTDFLYPDRVVLGANSEFAARTLQSIYEPLTSGRYQRQENAVPAPDDSRPLPRLIVTGTKSAELIKHASNAFLAMKISFINAVANICEAVGADVEQVCEGIGSDARIGNRFLEPGIGYGGSCFPKDLKAFRAVARECGYDFRLLDEVIHINDEQCERFLRKVRAALWTLRGKKLAVLGVSFKGGTDDIRESPALAVIRSLCAKGCRVVAYDPAAMERARTELPPGVALAGSVYAAASGADALLILTDWEEFAELDLQRLRKLLRYPIVIDGRNLYSRARMSEAGFMYSSVGRPDVLPSAKAPIEMPRANNTSAAD
jgi:UDPglucose 6-dehydrogenase